MRILHLLLAEPSIDEVGAAVKAFDVGSRRDGVPFTLSIAQSFHEVQDCLNGRKPDAVLSAVQMPGKFGEPLHCYGLPIMLLCYVRQIQCFICTKGNKYSLENNWIRHSQSALQLPTMVDVYACNPLWTTAWETVVKDLQMKNHDWERKGTCLNGPHVWKCRKCGEWTRSYDKPRPDAQLIDPDNGERYETNNCEELNKSAFHVSVR